MAYMNQERKAARMPKIKEIAKKYGVKLTVSVRNHRSLVATLKSGKIDFVGNYKEVSGKSGNVVMVNHYCLDKHFDGVALAFLVELKDALYGNDYFDESDSQTDYFHCSHYISIDVGTWNKPYQLTA